MIKYVVFDFDGTIIDSKGLGIQLYNELAAKQNFKIIQPEDIPALSSLSIPARCAELHVPLYRLPELIHYALKKYEEAIGSLQSFQGIKEVIMQLKSLGYIIGIISSNSQSNIKTFLQNNGIDEFDHIHSGKNLFGKHFIINGFLRKNNIQRDEMIYIADELRDIKACKKSRVRIISVTWGFDSVELLSTESPDFLVDRPSQILDIVKAHSIY
ncbi:MAG TPA: HAD-IA family hydrolase [Bacilli bacterium]